MRAIELLRLVCVSIFKTTGLKNNPYISTIMRRKIIETILYCIKTYPFCSTAHQQGLIVLNYLKDLLDDQDQMTLKNFVREIFSGDTKFTFPSGQKASGMNMGQITKIAFELKAITQMALDNMDSDADDDEDEEMAKKR